MEHREFKKEVQEYLEKEFSQFDLWTMDHRKYPIRNAIEVGWTLNYIFPFTTDQEEWERNNDDQRKKLLKTRIGDSLQEAKDKIDEIIEGLDK